MLYWIPSFFAMKISKEAYIAPLSHRFRQKDAHAKPFNK